MITLVITSLTVCVTSWFLWKALRDFILKSPLDNIPGPPSDSWWSGNIRKMFHPHDGWAFHEEMHAKYRAVVKFNDMFQRRSLYVYDPKAMHSIIVKDQHVYQKPAPITILTDLMLGPGLVGATGNEHKKQRKMLNPVFSIKHMRSMTPIFYRITHKLRDAISRQVTDGIEEIDILHWMGRTALELIGQGGLGYSFDPLVEDVSNHFAEAVKNLVPSSFIVMYFQRLVPFFTAIGTPAFRAWVVDLLPLKSIRMMKYIADAIHSQATIVFEDKKAALNAGDEALTKRIGEGKDLMSILLRENMMAEEGDKLSEDVLLGQMGTFLFAAMDTTSNALSIIIDLLSKNQDVQDKLRTEIKATCSTVQGDISYDQLVELPYLDAICRETMRLHSPVPHIQRESREDTILPLSWPIEGADGNMIHEVFVPKGTTIFVGVLASNVNKRLWGDDALEWKPERWLSPLPAAVSEAHLPGVYSNLMTFNGGIRSCIGFKFSQLEMKVVLSLLVKSFKFSPSDKEIVWNLGGIVYPTAGRFTNAPSMPIKVERVEV